MKSPIEILLVQNLLYEIILFFLKYKWVRLPVNRIPKESESSSDDWTSEV